MSGIVRMTKEGMAENIMCLFFRAVRVAMTRIYTIKQIYRGREYDLINT